MIRFKDVITHIKLVLISSRPNTWIRIWGEMVVAATLASYPSFNLVSLFLVFLATSPLLWTAAYMANDLTDIPYDRQHPLRKTRPIATGQLPHDQAIKMIIILCIASYALGYLVQPVLLIFLVCLTLSQCLYILPPIRLKERAFFDILVNGLNSVLRFFLGWYSQSVSHPFPYAVLILFVCIKIAFFFGHRMQNKSLEQQNHFRSSIAVLPTRTILVLTGSSIVIAGLAYGIALWTRVLPTWSVIGGMAALPMAYSFLRTPHSVISQEKNLTLRNWLYISYFLWANIVAATIILRLP